MNQAYFRHFTSTNLFKIFTSALWGTCYPWPHFIAEETEAQKINLPKVTELESDRAGIWTLAFWLQNHGLKHYRIICLVLE